MTRGAKITNILFLLGIILLIAGTIKIPTPAIAQSPAIRYVDGDVSASGDGTTWASAYKTIQEAINDPIVTEIWVKQGTYYPTEFYSPAGLWAILVNKPVRIYGGFNGGETALAERNWETNVTIVDATMGGTSRGLHITANAVIDGFTITGGSVGGSAVIFIGGCNAVIKNCVVTNNEGGGIRILGGSPAILNTIVFDNYCGTPIIGGIDISSASPLIANCLIFDNHGQVGGIRCDQDSNATITNCTIYGNGAGSGVSGVDFHPDSPSTITNSIIWGNDYISGTVDPYRLTSSQASYCDIQGVASPPSFPNSISEEPYFVNAGAGDFRFYDDTSPCINVGNNSAPGIQGTDFDGYPRIFNGIVDMGAYEYIGTPYLLTVTKSGNGTVRSQVAGIYCGLDCNESYASGTIVTLTAAPASGSYFGGWSGDCVSQALTCKVAMNEAKNVTATFTTTPPTVTTWAKTYGGTNSEQVSSIQQTWDGGYIVAGWISSSGPGTGDIWVLKLNADGTVAWQNTYVGSGHDGANSIQQTWDGGYIVAGWINSSGPGTGDIWVLKLNADGIVVWQKTYDGSGLDGANSIQQTSDGGYIVAGYSYSSGTGTPHIWVLKLNADGSMAWQKTYGGSGTDEAYSIQQTSDGGYIVAGRTNSFGAAEDIWVLKLNADASVAWQKTYGGSGSEGPWSIQQTWDGGYIVAGYTYSFGVSYSDMWILKLNSDGAVAWQKTYGTSGYDFANSIQQTWDGGYIVAGVTNSSGPGTGDIWVLKLNSDGSLTGPNAWQKTYGGSGLDEARSIQQTWDGGYIVVGDTAFGSGSGDIWVLKLDSNGDILGCPGGLVQTSSAVVGTPTITISFPTSTVADSSATINDTAVTPVTTTVIPGEVCTGTGCSYSILPTSDYYPSGGGGGSVSVTAPPGCSWTSQSNDSWIIRTSGASGSGNGTVDYLVTINGPPPGPARTGTMTIAGQTFTVYQSASPPPDSDGDGIPDAWEADNCPGGNCNPSEDLDGDGLTNLQEYQAGTNPQSSDTDGDGIPDGTDNCPKIYSLDNSCLLGWWKFDECSGTAVSDSSGLGNNGALSGSVGFTTDAVMGCASNFTAKDGIIRFPYSSTLEPVTGTIELWVKLDVLRNADILNKLTDKYVRTGLGEGGSVFGLRIVEYEYGPNFVPGAFVTNDDPTTPGSPWRAVSSLDPITAGEWHHLAMRWDGSKVAIFMDGVLRDETPYDPVPGTGLSYYGTPLYGFFLGNETFWGPTDTEFLGKLDDVRFYGRARTNDEIRSAFTSRGMDDNFLGDLIDRNIWADMEFVRRINNGVVESALRTYGAWVSNNMVFPDPNSISSIQTKVAVTEVLNEGAWLRARIEGRFYKNPEGKDIHAQIGILHTQAEGLRGYFGIIKCDDEECLPDHSTTIKWEYPPGWTVEDFGETKTLTLSWDGGTTFTFNFNGNEITRNAADYPGNAINAGTPVFPFKGFGLRNSHPTPEDSGGGYMAATFDDVYKNGEPSVYDDFNDPSGLIDETRWARWEFVRQVKNGVFESELARYGSNGSNNTSFVNSHSILGFEADLKVVDIQGNGASPRIRLYAGLYNDGTGSGQPGDITGDVNAGVGILDNRQGLGPQAFYAVTRCIAPSCNLPDEYEILASGIFKNVALNEIHRFSLSWNGVNATLGCDGSEISFNPTSVVPNTGPPKGRKGIGTRVIGIDDDAEWGYIAAAFDNVVITNIDSDLDGIDDNWESTYFGSPGACDPNADPDNDGLTNAQEYQFGTNPNTPDSDGDGIPDGVDPNPTIPDAMDKDGDGILDAFDNCPEVPNPGQEDVDGDGVGDVCDNCPERFNPRIAEWVDKDNVLHTNSQPDYDSDGRGDECDNCPQVANSDQADDEGDGIGNACDNDRDNDGIPDATDNCPDIFNPTQKDTNGNGIGDACDGTGASEEATQGPADPDTDLDGVGNSDDNCPSIPNIKVASWVDMKGVTHYDSQPDFDLDGIGDACDPCPDDPNNDVDGDGICAGSQFNAPKLGANDNCPTVYNPQIAGLQPDLDLDGIGDACDEDADNDGKLDKQCAVAGQDPCTLFIPLLPPSGDNCPLAYNPDQKDADNDGRGDACDPPQAYDIVFKMPTGLDYNTWLPTDNGVQFTVTAVVRADNIEDPSIPITFTVGKISRYRGRYTNDLTSGVCYNASTAEATLGTLTGTSCTSDASCPAGQKCFDPNPDFTPSFTTINQINLASLDNGGSITIHATADVPSAPGGKVERDFTLPKDTDGDGLPDAWENLYGDLDPNGDIDRTPNNDYIGDGLTNFEEYRGFKWGYLVPSNNSDYKTTAYVPDLDANNNQKTKHFRTDPLLRKDLFLTYTGYTKGYASEYPFAIGAAFKEAGIDVWALDASLASNLGSNNIHVAGIVHNTTTNYGSENGRINKRGIRDWTWDTKGVSGIGTLNAYGSGTKTYQKALNYYFTDRPYKDRTPGTSGILDPLSGVEDRDDDGVKDSGEDANNNGTLDGDLYYSSFATTNQALSPFDINKNGKVELPVVGKVSDVNPDHEYTKKQVLKHTITHELGHAVGAADDRHNSDPSCLMYQYSNNWSRDGFFSNSAKAKIQIHN